MRSPATLRRAFTVVELLVVIAIVGLLMALLLPAVQSAREAARKVQCCNNLRQIALAFLHYESTNGVLPHAGRDQGACGGCCSAAATNRTDWNFYYHILPHVEQTALYHAADALTVYRAPVPAYYCPSRRGAARYPTDAGTARADYAASSGDTDISFGDAPSNGVMAVRGCDKPVTFDMLLDGASNTLMLGEKQLHPRQHGRTGGDNEPHVNTGVDVDHVRCIQPEGQKISKLNNGCWLGPPAPDHQSREDSGAAVTWSFRFGSAHPQGLHGAMADGAIRSFTFGADFEALRALAVRDGGITVEVR